jgi:hypothetical protein
MSNKAKLPEPQRRREPVEVPEWGGIYYIAEISALDFDRIQRSSSDPEKDATRMAMELLAASLENEAGEHFAVEDIMLHPMRLVTRLINKSNEVNRLSSDQEAEKN